MAVAAQMANGKHCERQLQSSNSAVPQRLASGTSRECTGKARIKGQMDCIDESTNTDNFLRYLQSRGWLKHHTVARRTSRGAFFDGRYPHWTAVVEDKQGQKWAVDSGMRQAADRQTSCRCSNGSSAVIWASVKTRSPVFPLTITALYRPAKGIHSIANGHPALEITGHHRGDDPCRF